MTTTTTPTSGAADLPDALLTIAREIEALKRECGMDPESSIAVQNGRYMAISYKVRALAAGQATAAPAQPVAQQGVAYAALPEKYYLAGGEVPTWDEKQMHAFADATHALRASHGQAPAGATEPTEQQILEAAFAPAQPVAEPSRFGSPELQAMIIARCVEKDQADSVPAVSDLPPLPAPDLRDVGTKPQEIKEFLKGYATEYARTTIAARAPADSVQEDAALWHWLAEYLVGPRTDLDDEIVASETVNDLRKLVESAIKQGEKQ